MLQSTGLQRVGYNLAAEQQSVVKAQEGRVGGELGET